MVRRLADGDIEFVIVGGYAVVAYGASLQTQDLDVCCRFSPESLRQLARVLSDVHPRHRMTLQKLPLEMTDELASRMKNLYLDTDLCALDCLSEVAGIGGFEEVLRNSIEIAMPPGKCRVLTLEALIRAKETMGRAHDKVAVLQLTAIREKLAPRSQPPP